MREERHEHTEVVNADPARDDVVTTTDPVTGQVVHVNRTTGEVVTRPGVTQTIYQRTTDQGELHHQQIHHVMEDPYAARRMQIYKVEQAVYLIFGIIEALIAIRFVLRLLGANPAAGFANFIYGLTATFVAPFMGLFATPAYNGSVLESGSIIAILVYALIAWLLVRVIWLVAGEDRSGVRSTTERIDRHMR